MAVRIIYYWYMHQNKEAIRDEQSGVYTMQETMENILKKDGLSLKALEKLSYHSSMNINLKIEV